MVEANCVWREVDDGEVLKVFQEGILGGGGGDDL
jgi:hypothetical protein